MSRFTEDHFKKKKHVELIDITVFKQAQCKKMYLF